MFGPHRPSIRTTESIVLNFKLELHLDLHNLTAGGETENVYGSCKLKGCYLFEIFATLSPVPRTHPKQELSVLP